MLQGGCVGFIRREGRRLARNCGLGEESNFFIRDVNVSPSLFVGFLDTAGKRSFFWGRNTRAIVLKFESKL